MFRGYLGATLLLFKGAAETTAPVTNSGVIVSTEVPMTELVQQIADLGIMIVISAVVVIFVIKVMTLLIDQTKQSNSTILPKLDTIDYSINQAKSTIIENISAHNISANKQLSAIDLKIDRVSSDLDRIDRDLDRRYEAQQNTMVQLEKIEGVLLVIQSKMGINSGQLVKPRKDTKKSQEEQTKEDKGDQ